MTGAEWEPSNDVERELARALADSDGQAYFRAVAVADLYLPRFLADPAGEQRLLTANLFGQTFVPVFTSPAALAEQFGEVVDGCAVTNYAELRRKWPVPEWRLAINPGTPVDAYVSIEAIEAAAIGELSIPLAVDAIVTEMEQEDRQPVAPAPDTAALLHAAAARSDIDEYVRILLGAVLTLPTPHDVTDPSALFEPEFPWVRRGFPPTIDVFTSPEAYQSLAGGGPSIAVATGYLLALWPQGCSLALDPGAVHGITLTANQVLALALWSDPDDLANLEAPRGDSH